MGRNEKETERGETTKKPEIKRKNQSGRRKKHEKE